MFLVFLFSFIFLDGPADHRALHSFPTRRSSDLFVGHAKRRYQDAMRFLRATADAPAKLVQLCEPEALSMLNDHYQIGRASCRERVKNTAVAGRVEKKNKQKEQETKGKQQ